MQQSAVQSFGKTMIANYRTFIGFIVGFVIAAAMIFLLTPRAYVAISTLQVPTASFDFQVIVTSRTVAEIVASELHVPGGAETVQASTSLDPILPKFVYASAPSTLMTIATRASTPKLATEMNAAIIDTSFQKFVALDGKSASISVIDKPYVAKSRNNRAMETYLITGALLGFFIAYVLVWFRAQRYMS